MAYDHARYALLVGVVGVLVSGCAADVRVGPEHHPGDGSVPDAGHGGGGASGAAPSGTTTAAEEAACARYQRALCDVRERCYAPSLACDSFDCTDELFAEGTTRTPESVTACAQVYTTSSCDVLLAATPSCVTPGKRAAGAPCTANGQCASQRCSVTRPDEECGQCMSLAPKDGPCDAYTVCPAGQYCDGARCVDSPVQYLPAGAACIPSRQLCDQGTCEAPDGGMGKCVPSPGVGQSCSTFCAGTAVCSLDHRCEQPAALGQPCVLTEGTTSMLVGACAPGARCLDRTCVAPGKPGDPCEPKDDAIQCHLGECKCTDAACTKYACTERRYAGESCADANTFCDAPSQCIGGVCTSGKLGKPHSDPCIDGTAPGQ